MPLVTQLRPKHFSNFKIGAGRGIKQTQVKPVRMAARRAAGSNPGTSVCGANAPQIELRYGC